MPTFFTRAKINKMTHMFFQVREVIDRNKPNCFELYATGGNDFIKGMFLKKYFQLVFALKKKMLF